MEIASGSCHLAISGDQLSSTYDCHPISWTGQQKSKRRKRGLEEGAEDGALQEVEEDVDGEVAKAEEKVKLEVVEVKGEEEGAEVEEAEVAAEEEDGDQKKSRERG